MVDICMLLQRSVQMRELQRHDQKVRIETLSIQICRKSGAMATSCFKRSSKLSRTRWTRSRTLAAALIRVSAEVRGEQVVLQFSDSGPGIKEPHRVFDPFYTTKPIGKGTGLGLSAVYGVVQDHKGLITCQNKTEGGALFVLVLPIASENASAPWRPLVLETHCRFTSSWPQFSPTPSQPANPVT